MSEFIWYWKEGNSKIYTKSLEDAEKAMKQGLFIMGMKINPDLI